MVPVLLVAPGQRLCCTAVPASVQSGWCDLYNLLTESKRGVAAGVHTYLKHINNSDPSSPVEDQMPHIAAFTLARAENWYYFGSTGWWDDDFRWTVLWDKASNCGLPLGPAPAVTSGPVFRRQYQHCQVTLDCTNTSYCRGSLSFNSSVN